MDYSAVFAISAAGMRLERTRVEVAAVNLANAHSAASRPGEAFQPLRVVGVPAASFANLLKGPDYHVAPAAVMPRLVHEPGHPAADARGFVSYPGVDPATEMVSLLGASRAFEANVAALNTARHLALKALDIGSGS